MAQTVSVKIVSEDKVITIPANMMLSTKEEALMKAGMVWGALWVLMIGTIFIPIVHFIAPPILIFMGPIAGRIVYKMFADKQTLKLETTPPTCPKCSASIVLPSSLADWPVHNVCMECKTSFSAEY